MAPKANNSKDNNPGPNKQKTLLGFFSKVQGPSSSASKPSNPTNSNSNSNSSANPTTSTSAFSPASSSGASPASTNQASRSLPLETPPTSVGRGGEISNKSKSSSASASSVAKSSKSTKSNKKDSEMDEDEADPPSSSPAMLSPTISRQKPTSLKSKSNIRASGSGRMGSKDDYDDDDDDEDEQPVTQRRSSAKKRPSTYAESASEDGSDSDAGAFKPAKKSSLKKPAAKRRKADDDDGDDFIVADDDVSEAEIASVAMSVENEESEEEAPVTSKSKKGKSATRSSPIQGFKMGSTPSTASAPRPSLSTNARGSSNSHLTKAERRVEDEKRKKHQNEQAYSFLQDLRDKDGNRVDSPNYDPRTVYVPKSAWSDFTPFEKQFWEIKQNHWDTVLFFQKGKFYELYEEDALIGHREFDLKLTDRVKMKMVGVPESSFEIFAAKFLALGYKVGRVDQVETAVAKDMRLGGEKKKAGTDIVRRELRHVLTGGTIVDAGALPDDLNSYCLSIKESLEGDGERTIPTFGICSLDASTAEFNLTWFQDDESRTKLETLLRSLRLKELIHEKGGLSAQTLRVLRNTVPQTCQTTMLKAGSEFLDEQDTLQRLDVLFSKENAQEDDEDAMDLDGKEPAKADKLPQAISSMLDKPEAVSALGGLLWYLSQLNLDRDLCSSRNFNIFDPIRQSKCLILDAQSLTHLNVLSNEQGTDEGTLHRLLNRCVTPFGKRLFKVWLVAPLATAAAIGARQDAVDDFLRSDDFSDAFGKFAKKLPDIERIIPRIIAGKCKPADFTKVLNAFASFKSSIKALVGHTEGFESPTIKNLLQSIPNVTEKATTMQGKFLENKEDGSWIPREDVNEAFDEAENGLKSVEQALEDELVQYRKDLGLSKGAIKFKHIGTKDIYQVEVPRGTKVPKDWTQMSTTKKELRFYSPEIKSLVQQLKEARETRLAALKKFHSELFSEFADNSPLYLAAVKTVAEIDCLLSLAKASEAMGQPACRPEIVDSDVALVDFEELRHPCMGLGSKKDFIPNSVKLGGDDNEVIILTGGNMAGKSTTARTTATAVILAQLGCRVPATRARIAPVDRIASRMGANDQIFRNNSTFMVEMLEASRILRECTPRSLVIMDELGRGTSTFDGQSIAFAVLHHLIGRTRCLGFFLTHYTSLARDFNSYPRVSNKHMEVIVDELEVLFTYRLVDGIAESSYGTQVAALAGVPSTICVRASEVSQQFMEASEAEQAQRVQNRIPVATLADFSRLVEISQMKDEEMDEDELDLLGSQCQVITAQIKALAALESAPSSASAPVVEATPTQTSASERRNAPSKMVSYSRKNRTNQDQDESFPSRTPSRISRETSNSPIERSRSSPIPISTPLESSSHKRKRGEAQSSPIRSRSNGENASNKKRRNKPQEQLILDFGQKLRMTCKECDMSYDRSSPDDVSLHSKHHERMTKGVDWSAKSLYNSNFVENLSSFSIGKEGLKKLSGNGSGKLGVDSEVKILRYELGMNLDSILERKVNEILSSIDSALGAAALPQEDLKTTKLFVAVGPNQRIVGAVLVGRVKVGTARRVVPPSEKIEDDQGTVAFHDSSGGDAIFVSSPLPASQTPPLAVHRIHVLPCLRRFGIGSRLLDSVLSNGVYGIGASELVKMHGGRLGAVAFSQPTMAGRDLAEGWGRKGLKEEGEGKGLVVFEE